MDFEPLRKAAVAEHKPLPGIMTKFVINELSGVDRPAQAGAVVTIMKRDAAIEDPNHDPVIGRTFTPERRQELAARGIAEPSGAYPIEDQTDLEHAVRAFGRSKTPAETKAHIIRRARALGATDALPESWNVDDDEGENETDQAVAKMIARGAEIRKATVERWESNSGPKPAQLPLVGGRIAVSPSAAGAGDSQVNPDNKGPLGYDRPDHSADNVTGGWPAAKARALGELDKRARERAKAEKCSYPAAYAKELAASPGLYALTR